MNAIPLINNAPKLRQNPHGNETQLRQEINTSLVALKKEAGTLEGLINEAAQMLVTINNRIATLESDTVKKSDVVDVVQSGNLQPVTSNAVSAYKTSSVTSGSDLPITSGAVAQTTEIVTLFDVGSGSPFITGSKTLSENINNFKYFVVSATAGSVNKQYFGIVGGTNFTTINFIGADADGQRTTAQMLTFISQLMFRIYDTTISISINAYNSTAFRAQILQVYGISRK